MYFIYCFDKETRDYLTRLGLTQLNPDSPAPYIFSSSPVVDLTQFSELAGRYILTNEMIYTTEGGWNG